MESVAINGIDLSAYCTVADVKRPMPHLEPSLEHPPGRDGYVLRDASVMPSQITFKLILRETDAERMRRAVRELAPILLQREPVELAFRSDEGLFYLAVPTEDVELSEFVNCGSIDVTYQPIDAAMYGREATVTVPSGGSVEFMVGGTAPARPRLLANSATRNASTGLWGITLDEMGRLEVPCSASGALKVEADCAERWVRVSNALTLPTLRSDWLSLEPGRHMLRNHSGTGACTVTWRERWL